jgi:site-specific recombinase XerD
MPVKSVPRRGGRRAGATLRSQQKMMTSTPPPTANRRTSSLRRLYDWAIAEGHLVADPTRDVKSRMPVEERDW